MKIITLSRQIGSYGDEIANMVAERLGFHLVNQEEVHRLGEECDDGFKKACSLFEREVPKGFLERFFFDKPAYTSLFKSLVFELASRGSVILVGRGSQVVLHEVRGVLRSRIVAPFDVRVARIAEEQNLPLDKAGDFVHKHGHARRALIEGIFHHDVSDWALYDLIINTQDMTPEDGAHILASAAEKMKPIEEEADFSARLKRMSFAKRVESAIRKEVTGTGLGEIEVECPADGQVVLSGTVNTKDDRQLAQEIAEKFDEVKSVDNQIRVLVIMGY